MFRAYSAAGGPTEAGSSAFLGRGLLRIRNRRLGGRAAGVLFLEGFIELVGVMMLMFVVLSTLFIPLFLLYFFSVDVSSLWRMFLMVLGVRVHSDSLGCSFEVLECCLSSWSMRSHFFSSSLGKLGSSGSPWLLQVGV